MNGHVRAVLIDGDGGFVPRYRRSAHARKFFKQNGLSYEEIESIYDQLDTCCATTVNKQCLNFVGGLIQVTGSLLVMGGIVYAIVNAISTSETAKVMGAIFGGVGMIVAGFLCLFIPSCYCTESSKTVLSIRSELGSLERKYPKFYFVISNSTHSIPQLRAGIRESTASSAVNHSALPVATATAVSMQMTTVEVEPNEGDPNSSIAASAPPVPSSAPSSRERIASEIARLHALYSSGVLNQEEFERAKEKILA